VIHAQVTDDLRALAAAYVLGSLEADEARRFAEHLAGGCDACRAEVEDFAAVADDLALAVAPVAPPASARARLLADVGAPAEHPAMAASPLDARFVFVDGDHEDWEDVAPGVARRALGTDRATRSRSYVIRMQPGATLRSHAHTVVEHCYILQGDFEVAGRRMQTGDYHLAPPGTLHDGLRSEGGCVFLIVECQP
jgi:anti-sigma factor ChrR (cupin superfamily)